MPALYSFALCPDSRFIQLILGELGVDYEVEETKPWVWDEALAALNPAGTLPVIVDMAEKPLCGSYAISEYLAEVTPALKSLRPQMELLYGDAAQRGEIRRVTEWFLVKFHKDTSSLLLDEILLKNLSGGGEPDMETLRTGRENLTYHLSYMTHLLQQQPWLAGEQVSMADLAAAAQLSCLDYISHIRWKDIPEVKEWYSRLKSRPSFRPMLAARVGGNPPPSYYTDLDF